MASRMGGQRRKSRHIFKKNVRRRGKLSLKNYFREFKIGERVGLIAEPAEQKGLYHPRYYGKTGVVKAKKGRCYEVIIHDRKKRKILIVHPVHIKKIEETR